jgi:hypothetical protein
MKNIKIILIIVLLLLLLLYLYFYIYYKKLDLDTNKISYDLSNLSDYIMIYFKTYAFCTWNLDKLYIISENNKELKSFCQDISDPLEKCNPPYKFDEADDSINTSNCCAYTNSKKEQLNVSKRSINKFNINSNILSDDISFKFIKEFDKITTINYKNILNNYKIQIILENLNLVDEFLFQNIFDIMQNYGIKFTNNSSYNNKLIHTTLNDPDFIGIDNILDLIYPFYKINPRIIEYQKKIIDIPYIPIQVYNNRLFEQTTSQNKKIYYLYFSFGISDNIKYLKNVDWQDVLKPYIKLIVTSLQNESILAFVIGGHSIGSVIMQYLGLELIKTGIDLSKIFIIGSGCRVSVTLNDEQLMIFKKAFSGRYFFVVTGYINENKIYYEHYNYNGTHLNKIDTHLLLYDKEESNSIILDEINIDIDMNMDMNKFEPIDDAELHEFKSYAELYINYSKF